MLCGARPNHEEEMDDDDEWEDDDIEDGFGGRIALFTLS
jgi:hypothetical protein